MTFNSESEEDPATEDVNMSKFCMKIVPHVKAMVSEFIRGDERAFMLNNCEVAAERIKECAAARQCYCDVRTTDFVTTMIAISYCKENIQTLRALTTDVPFL